MKKQSGCRKENAVKPVLLCAKKALPAESESVEGAKINTYCIVFVELYRFSPFFSGICLHRWKPKLQKRKSPAASPLCRGLEKHLSGALFLWGRQSPELCRQHRPVPGKTGARQGRTFLKANGGTKLSRLLQQQDCRPRVLQQGGQLPGANRPGNRLAQTAQGGKVPIRRPADSTAGSRFPFPTGFGMVRDFCCYFVIFINKYTICNPVRGIPPPAFAFS